MRLWCHSRIFQVLNKLSSLNPATFHHFEPNYPFLNEKHVSGYSCFGGFGTGLHRLAILSFGIVLNTGICRGLGEFDFVFVIVIYYGRG